jgi:hypothetical protein
VSAFFLLTNQHFDVDLLFTSALQAKQDISPIVMNVISCLVPIISNGEVCNRVEIIVLG